jgi:hypothetical protein
MNWTEILSRAGIPESPGYAEASDPSGPMATAQRIERERQQALARARKPASKGKPKPKPGKGY